MQHVALELSFIISSLFFYDCHIWNCSNCNVCSEVCLTTEWRQMRQYEVSPSIVFILRLVESTEVDVNYCVKLYLIIAWIPKQSPSKSSFFSGIQLSVFSCKARSEISRLDLWQTLQLKRSPDKDFCLQTKWWSCVMSCLHKMTNMTQQICDFVAIGDINSFCMTSYLLFLLLFCRISMSQYYCSLVVY